MPTLSEQLLEIERQEVDANQELGRFNNVTKYINNLETIALVISCILIFTAVFFIYSNNFHHTFGIRDWFLIIVLTFYPGFFGVILLTSILEQPLEFLSYRLNNTTKSKYNAATSKVSRIRKEKNAVQRQIEDEESRIQRKKETDEWRIKSLEEQEKERIEKQNKDEGVRIQKEISRAKEWRFITTLNDAVDRIQSRKMPFEEATNLYTELKREYAEIRFLYYHTNIYYDNRFYKIKAVLNKYDFKSTSNPHEPTLGTKSYQISTGNKPEINPTETEKVYPFSPNYIPVIQTEIPISKVDSPTVPDKPVTDTEPTTPKIEQPVLPFKPVTEIESPTVSEPPISKIESPVESNKSLAPPELPAIPEKPIEEEMDITELFKNKRELKPRLLNQSIERIPIKLDYVKLNEARSITGKLGELYALDWELKRLERKGLKMYCDNVVHVSLTDDSLGYDILSFCDDGSPKYIEVKTTTDTWNSPFYLTENEITAMDNLNDYFIYRIYNFNIESKSGVIFSIDCDVDIEKYYNIQPVSYRILPK